jgi:hypothetical protein
MDRAHGGVEQAGAVKFPQDGHDATGAVYVFHVNVGLGRRALAFSVIVR